jgi:hypothetical protein
MSRQAYKMASLLADMACGNARALIESAIKPTRDLIVSAGLRASEGIRVRIADQVLDTAKSLRMWEWPAS